jgi:hypothetical protein
VRANAARRDALDGAHAHRQLMLAALLDFQRIGGRMTPKTETSSAETGIPQRKVFPSLVRLRTLGLLEWNRGNRLNIY